MSLPTMFWRDSVVIVLLGVGYGVANASLLLPLIVIVVAIVALIGLLQLVGLAERYSIAATVATYSVFAILLVASSTSTWPYIAPLAGLLVLRGDDIRSSDTLPLLTGALLVLVGASYARLFDSVDLARLAFPVVSVVIGILRAQHPAVESTAAPVPATSITATRLLTASHPSFEMPSIAPFAFDSDSTDRGDEIAQQLETIRTVISQQVNQSARQIHTVEQLTVTLRNTQEQLQSARHLLQTIDGTVMDVMDTTTLGHTSVKDTQRQLQQALDTVQTVGQTMAQLVGDLRRVSEIVTAVSDVATQSNFLALNAQIEAARAGELGRGFTIVAEEVRDLATQSRESTKTMKGILRSIHQASSQAVRVTEASSGDIASYVTSTEQLDQFVTTIEETINNTHRTLLRVIGVIEQLQNQIEQLATYNQQLNQQTMQSQASLLMADNLSQSVQAILTKH